MSSKSKESNKNANRHVIPEQGRWVVKTSGSDREQSAHATQAEAIDAAKKATAKNAQVIVHGRNGRIRQTISKSRADEIMMGVWKDIHAENSQGKSRSRKVS